MIIATRSDLDAAKGTPDYDRFLAGLRGTLTTQVDTQVYPPSYDSTLQVGDLGYLPPVIVETATPETAARFGFTPEDLAP